MKQITKQNVEEAQAIAKQAIDGLYEARLAATKLKNIGVNIDYSSLEAEVERVKQMAADIEREYLTQGTSFSEEIEKIAQKEIKDNPELLARLDKLEFRVLALGEAITQMQAKK